MSTRVMVIDDRPGINGPPPFKFGDIVHISDIPILTPEDKYFCFVDEYCIGVPFSRWNVWRKERFAPTSDNDETEIHKEIYETDKVCSD